MHYQILDNTYELDRKKKEKLTNKKYIRPNLIYYIKFSLYEYYNITFNSRSLTSKFKVLTSFYNELNRFYRLISQKESAKEKKATVYNNVSEM